MDVNIILLLLSATGLSLSSDCSRPLGTDDKREFTAARDHSFYLNTAHPAVCSGTIRSWRYCYYVPSVVNDTIDVYRTSFAVYRRMMDSSGSYTYGRVSRVFSIRELREDLVNVHNSSFVCGIYDENDFTIEAGDLVGACIFDPIDNEANSRFRSQLDIVGEAIIASGYPLLRMTDVSECAVGLNRLPSSIPHNMLSVVESRVLHLYAYIESMYIYWIHMHCCGLKLNVLFCSYRCDTHTSNYCNLDI